MVLESKNPGALAGAAGAQESVKATSTDSFEDSTNPSWGKARRPDAATLHHLRAAHLVRHLGVSDHAATMLAALAFAGAA